MLLIGSNGSNTTDEQFLVDNTIISCKRNLRAGAGLESNTINTVGNNNLNIQRGSSTLITLNSSNQVQLSGDLVLPTPNTQYIRFNTCRIREGLAGVISYFDFINADTAGHFRFYLGEIDNANLKMSIQPNIINLFNETVVNQKLQIITGYGLESNLIDTNGDNDLVISRNNIPFLTLDKFTEDTVEKEAIICSKQLTANSNMSVKKLQINQIPVGIEYADFRLEDASNSIIRFFVGNSTSVNLQIAQTATLNEILLNRATKCSNVFHTNTIDTNTDTDLLIKRSGTEALRIRASDNLILTSDTAYFSSPKVYSNEYLNRTSTYDTVFYGANSTSDGRVEYMKWNRAGQTLDFNAPIDNTNISIIGNIIDTTVSDERLKTNIQDVESNYCDCVKNVQIKTFEYKDEKYKDSDKYGFIAQHLQKHLPKEFDNIVKETKPKKDEGEAYLSINYMKLSVVLWGALQETLNKVEHLEASVYELQNGVKKVKPKAKSKSKNVD